MTLFAILFVFTFYLRLLWGFICNSIEWNVRIVNLIMVAWIKRLKINNLALVTNKQTKTHEAPNNRLQRGPHPASQIPHNPLHAQTLSLPQGSRLPGLQLLLINHHHPSQRPDPATLANRHHPRSQTGSNQPREPRWALHLCLLSGSGERGCGDDCGWEGGEGDRVEEGYRVEGELGAFGEYGGVSWFDGGVAWGGGGG